MPVEFDIGNINGLSAEEAARRLAGEDRNEIPTARRKGIFSIAFEVLREPMFLLLVAGSTVYLTIGDLQEGLILLSFVLVIIGITFYQGRRTERALEALRDLSSPRALVIRDGEQLRIAGRDVVRGDTLLLSEGDRVPSDAVVRMCINLSADESLLTGESIPVRKSFADGDIPMGRPGGDDEPFVFSGTVVVGGRGVAEVLAIGKETEMGKIGKALEEIKPERTRLQKETTRIVRNIFILAVFLFALVIVVYGLTRHEAEVWYNALIAGLALAMAMIPEEFPVVLTVFLTMGAWRISKKEVLTRRVPAVETLGSATVLCVDKTGTLTYNRISVSRIHAQGEFYELGEHVREPLPEKFHEVVEFGILGSQKDPFDPLERAVKRLGDRKLFKTEHIHDDWSLLREYPLSENLLALSHVWKSPSGQEYVIAAKGAPEAITDLCHLDERRSREVMSDVGLMAEDGLRVIGVAKAHFTEADLPVDQHEFVFEFLGLIGLADPVRPNVPNEIRECYDAGIRVIMITGDYPGTAMNVARRIGLEPADEFVTGGELDAMDDDVLTERIKYVNIFARVVPEQKLRIVDALKANDEIVAMTGDGVNDAPALKSAQIGIAMGGRGTDVAREASELVLLNDDFSSIEEAVRLGRRIFDNLKKAMAYILAVHVPIAGISLLPVLFKWPLVLLPVHIAFLELIIDPACSVVFEGEQEETDVMTRPPRTLSEPLFNKRTVALSLLQGLFVLVVIAFVFRVALYRGLLTPEARALTFTTLVLANLGLILINRSWTRTIVETMRSPNRALLWVFGGALVFLGLVLYVPALKQIFHFGTLSAIDIAISFGAAVLSIAWFEVLKLFLKRKKRTV